MLRPLEEIYAEINKKTFEVEYLTPIGEKVEYTPAPNRFMPKEYKPANWDTEKHYTQKCKCPKHGEIEIRLHGEEKPGVCPQCQEEANKARDAEKASWSYKYSQIAQKKAKSGLDGNLINRSLDAFEPYDATSKAAQEALKRFAINDRYFFAMYGKKGTCKSVLCAGLINAVCELGKECYYIELPVLNIRVKSSFSNKSKRTFDDIYEQLINPDLLVIDEFGDRRMDDNLGLLIEALIIKRENLGKKTVFAGNYDIQILWDLFGDHVKSRFIKTGDYVELLGEDQRPIWKEKKQEYGLQEV